MTYDLSPSEAADRLGVHAHTLKRWARDGKIRGFRTPGGHWRFRQADLDEFVASRVREPEREPAA
jgi:excisionase family DNA binding protein